MAHLATQLTVLAVALLLVGLGYRALSPIRAFGGPGPAEVLQRAVLGLVLCIMGGALLGGLA